MKWPATVRGGKGRGNRVHVDLRHSFALLYINIRTEVCGVVAKGVSEAVAHLEDTKDGKSQPEGGKHRAQHHLHTIGTVPQLSYMHFMRRRSKYKVHIAPNRAGSLATIGVFSLAVKDAVGGNKHYDLRPS